MKFMDWYKEDIAEQDGPSGVYQRFKGTVLTFPPIFYKISTWILFVSFTAFFLL